MTFCGLNRNMALRMYTLIQQSNFLSNTQESNDISGCYLESTLCEQTANAISITALAQALTSPRLLKASKSIPF